MSLSKLRTIIAVTIALVSLLVTTAFPQQGTRDLFERARMLDESNQNLSEAIKLYGQVVSQSNEQRALAARAQYRIGVLYERLGRKAEAQRAFQTVVKQYGDQSDVATRARAKLPATVGNVAGRARTAPVNKAPTGMAVRRISADLDAMNVNYVGMPSPDDRYLAFCDRETCGNLAVRDLLDGRKRLITKGDLCGIPGQVQKIAWSPDSKQLAYSWNYTRDSRDLRLIGLDGSGMRILYRNVNEETGFCDPSAWSPDGKFILADCIKWHKSHQIVLVAIADGSVRVLKTIDSSRAANVENNKIDFSPDGRYIVYDYRPQPNSSQRDIFVLSVEDGHEIPLIQHPADDYVLGWAPDGKSILFASDRTGMTDAWIISVADGKAQSGPELVKRDVGSIEPRGFFYPWGFTRSGSYYYSLSTGMTDVYLTTLDSDTGKIVSPPTPVSSRFVGINEGVNDRPGWSSDGHQLVFVSQRQKTAAGSVVSILSTNTGKLREVTPKLAEVSFAQLLADGQTIVVLGSMKDGRSTWYKINEQTGEATPWELTPAASGDTRKFSFRESGNSIIALNRETGEERTIYNAPQSTYRLFVIGQGNSPDGQRLAFTAENGGGSSILSVVQADGAQPRTLLTLKTPERLGGLPNGGYVLWTPDGRYILFVKKPNVTAAAELWRIAAEGGKPQYLGLAMEDLRQVRLNPDGRQLAFTAGKKRNQIWVMENFLPKQNAKDQSRRIVSGRR